MYLQRLEVVLWSCGADPDEISLLDIGQVGGNDCFVLRLGIQHQLDRLPFI
jgi:hypothetical protein